MVLGLIQFLTQLLLQEVVMVECGILLDHQLQQLDHLQLLLQMEHLQQPHMLVEKEDLEVVELIVIN